MNDWQPELYNRFSRFRQEPVALILQRLGALDRERNIIDLGCGSGENTVELARQAPSGRVLGIDSSQAMIEQANLLRAKQEPDLASRLEFRLLDLRQFRAQREYTLIFSNAAIQWVGDHPAVLAACAAALCEGGRMAIQMPANDTETAQVTLVELARSEPWRRWLGEIQPPSGIVAEPPFYVEVLSRLGLIDVECEYHVFHHPMRDCGEIIEFMRSTTLRPFLPKLPEDRAPEFLAALRLRLERAYGTSGAVIFPFRRLFIWAARPGN